MLESTLFIDTQAARPADFCPVCGAERYAPGRVCLRCRRRKLMTMAELSESYREAAHPLRLRLATLRLMMRTETDPEEIWHLKRRIAELTPMLTEMNELAELTEHYYDRGYYRSEKYTV